MASILVNSEQWNSLSNEDKNHIIDGLKGVGSVKDNDDIVPSDSAEKFDAESFSIQIQWEPWKEPCKIACDVTAGAAFAWCSANTGGAATAICMAVAEAARNECKNRC